MKESKDGLFIQTAAWVVGEAVQLTRKRAPAQKAWRRLVADVLIGRSFELSDKIDVLEGFSIRPEVDEGFLQVQEILETGPVLWILNHWNGGPLGEIGTAIATAEALRQTTKIEPFLTLGTGRFSPVSVFRKQIEKSCPVVLVGGSGTGRRIPESLAKGKQTMFFPEGTNSRFLRQGNPRAGSILRTVARMSIGGNKVPIVPVGVYSQDRVFQVLIGLPLDNGHLANFTPASRSKEVIESAGQNAVDYAMRKIAALLPENLRGYYR